MIDTLRVPLLIDGEPGCAAPTTAYCSLADQPAGGAADGSQGGETAPPPPAGETPR